ncbi:hypothetical protein [Mitsuokella multacida]|uniref:hypothetical protein n=1 Tax=Mitsuokella multacida TaxID=52226 RepID=UPI00241DA0DA|nr:hypothetical protein [Mitsuokella multacida]
MEKQLKDKTLQIRISPSRLNMLRFFAKEDNIKVSSLLNTLIDTYIMRHMPDANAAKQLISSNVSVARDVAAQAIEHAADIDDLIALCIASAPDGDDKTAAEKAYASKPEKKFWTVADLEPWPQIHDLAAKAIDDNQKLGYPRSLMFDVPEDETAAKKAVDALDEIPF